MKCLFVGGDYDGEMLDVDPDSPYYLMPCKESASIPSDVLRKLTQVSHKQSYARHEFIDTDHTSHIVYVGGGNQTAPLLEVIKGYASLAAKPKHSPLPEAPVQAVPDGWQLVPKKETHAMHDAVMSYLCGGISRLETQKLLDAYLAAAPQPDKEK